MTGHHSWEKLMRERHTPEERARIRADALKMLKEGDRGRGQEAGRVDDSPGAPTESATVDHPPAGARN